MIKKKNKKKVIIWDIEITSKRSFLQFNFKELIKYIDLIQMFVKRDFVTFYKQTILGPLWYLIQPLVNTIVFTIIFGKLAQISTDGTDPFIFYMSGTVIWGFFSTSLTANSTIFLTNANIFGKVYFPRYTVPIANTIIALLQFIVQFLLFLSFYIYFLMNGAELNFQLSLIILFLPLLLIQTSLLGIGFGSIFSSVTTKYRDLTFVLSFGVQLWMFATPIVYPFSIIPDKYKILASLNPMTSVVESFRFIFFGFSEIELIHILISSVVTFFIFIYGYLIFNKVEKNFMDTI